MTWGLLKKQGAKMPLTRQEKKKLNNHSTMKVNVNPDELPDIVCSKCQSKIFQPAQRIKKLSAILSPDGKKRYVNIPVVICAMCKEELPQRP